MALPLSLERLRRAPERLWAPLIVAVYLLACNLAALGHYVDDIVWVLLGESVLKGSVSAAWSAFPRAETSANWGFAVLLAPALAVFGRDAVLLKAWCAVLLLAGTWLFYLATRDEFSPGERHVYLLALFLNNFMLGFSGSVTSEAGYALLFGALVWLLVAKKRLWEAAPGEEALLGLLSASLVATRTIGAVLLLAAAAELARARRWRPLAAYLAGAALVLGPYFLAQKLLSGHYSYHQQGWLFWRDAGWAGFLSALGQNAWFYLKGLSSLTFLFLPPFIPESPALKAVVAATLSGVALSGAGRASQSRPGRFLALYGVLYLLVCSAWAYRAPRFVLPLYPLFILWFLAGLKRLVPGKRRGLAFGLLGLAVLGTNAGELGRMVRASLSSPADIPHRSQLWLRDHSRPEDLVVSMDIARVFYYAGRRGVHFVPSESLEDFVRRSRELNARFFFLKEPSYVPASPGLVDPVRAQYDRLAAYAADGRFFEKVYEDREEGVRIYRPRS